MAQKLSFACVEMYDGLREGWHTVAIGIHLKSTLLSFCPVFCFVFVLFCLFGCFLCVLLFVVFVLFAFLLVCARSRQLDSFMDYVKVHTSSLL